MLHHQQPYHTQKKEKSKIGHNRPWSETTDCPQPSEASMSNTFNRDGYYFEGEKIYYRDVFIANRNETITVIMDIDPDAPSMIRHGDPKLMGPTIERLRDAYRRLKPADRYFLGIPMQYMLPAREDILAKIQDVLDNNTHEIPRFVEWFNTMRINDSDAEKFTVTSILV